MEEPVNLRRRIAALAVALVAAGTTLFGTAGPAAAAPFPPITPVIHPCFITPQLCFGYSNGSFTAWSLMDVGPTPYAFVIWNVTLHDEMRLCGFGTSCSVSPGPVLYPPAGRCYAYIAYIGAGTNSMPPVNTIAASPLLQLCG
jgi:hypothetical protein